MLDSSSLLDSSSGVVAFVQSLDSTTAGAMGVVDLAGADMLLEGKELGVKVKKKKKTGLIFIHPIFVLRQSLQTPHCARRPHDSLIGASWVRPLKGGYCYDHVQLQVLSSYSGRIAALQLNSGHSPLTLVALVLIPFH